MKAAVLHEFKQPLRIEDVPTPTCAADEVLIRVEASGVCHSDLHLADGDWPELLNMVKMKSPVILGHEVVGRVIEKGGGVLNFAVGERVGVPWVHWTCGQCEFCQEGNENLCPAQAITGYTVDGGHAEFCRAKASHVTKIPDKLPQRWVRGKINANWWNWRRSALTVCLHFGYRHRAGTSELRTRGGNCSRRVSRG